MLLALAFACVPEESDTHTDTEPTVTTRLAIVALNTESGGSDPAVVAESAITPVRGETIWGFEEVESESVARQYVAAADDGGQDWQYVYGTTGWDDHLVLAWDDDVWELVDSWEEDHINVGGDVRAPLVGKMRSRENGAELLVMINHLWRSEDWARHEQAELLHDWALDQDLPLVTAGDFNFDWAEEDGDRDHDQGYDLMTEGGAWEWVRPAEIVATQCSNYRSVLDFVFVGGEAKEWEATSEVLFPTNGYCTDEDDRSDHRPIRAEIEVPG